MTVINTNIAANNTYRQMSLAAQDNSKSMERLSSGLRINRAADDAAGLSIAEGLRSQSRGLEVAARNANDGVSLVQTAEGGLAEAHSILQRVRELTVQAGNDSNNVAARTAIKTEIDSLGNELNRMAESITFNGVSLLNGTGGPNGDGSFSFQVGAAGVANDTITLDLSGADLAAVGAAVLALDVTDATNATASIAAVDGQIAAVSAERANLGATQNRLETTIKHVNVSKENLTAAESRIRDVDMAQEVVKQSAANIKQQAAQAMLAQANQASSGVLQLLR